MQESVKTFYDAILRNYLGGDNPFEEVPSLRSLGYECVAFVQKNKAKPPKWLSFIERHFDVRDLSLMNAFNSFLLLLKAKDRIFAASFGYGHNAIDRSKIEQGFGMKVTLNEIDPERIETLDTRKIDLVTKQRRTHVTVGSRVSDFDLNQNIDWIRYVSGRPISKDFARKLSGADSLSITVDTTIEGLGKLCGDLFDKYTSDNYKKYFGFIDYLKPLKRNDPRIVDLNEEVRSLIDSRSTEKITVAHPEIPDPSVLRYRISFRHAREELDEVSLEGIYSFLNDHKEIDDYMNSVRIVGLDSEDMPITDRYALKDFIVAEISKGSESYILSLGEWFQVDSNYVQTIREKVRSISDVTEVLHLPPIEEGQKEGDYNEKLSNSRDWLLFDKELMYVSQNEKYEVCDILTPDKKFLCVKKMNSSATLSHLFSQGSVSAKLLRRVPEVEVQIRERYVQKWPHLNYDSSGAPEFVYVIPTKKEGPLSDCLFFFSLINLIDHVEAIRESGFNVSLCKVSYKPKSV
jgi:uncharacterized protein (TIGR04141 family)